MSRYWLSRGQTTSMTTVGMVLVLGLAGACGANSNQAAPTTAPTVSATTTATTVPAGYTAFADSVDDWSIAVPVSWSQVNPITPAGEIALGHIIAADPSLANGGETATNFTNDARFFAYGPTGAVGSYRPNLDVLVKVDPGVAPSDLPSFVDGFMSAYRTSKATLRSQETVSLAGHREFRATLLLPVVTPTGARLTVPATIAVLIADSRVYEVFLLGTSPEFSTILSTFSLT